MDKRFADVISSLDPSLRKLLAMSPVTTTTLPREMPKAGIYLFSEGERHLYVGRSNNICGRLKRHSTPGATHRMAAFAFRLAREATGKVKATYTTKGSRAELMKDEKFRKAFNDAKARIRKMDVRFVEEANPVRQAILELYVAVVLPTDYNDFDNH